MNVIKEILEILFTTVWSLLTEMLKSSFTISGAIDDTKAIFVAGVLGISVGAASLMLAIFSVAKSVLEITRNDDFHR